MSNMRTSEPSFPFPALAEELGTAVSINCLHYFVISLRFHSSQPVCKAPLVPTHLLDVPIRFEGTVTRVRPIQRIDQPKHSTPRREGPKQSCVIVAKIRLFRDFTHLSRLR